MESWPLTTSQIIILGCAPLLMVVVSLAEGRWGPRMAGMVAAAPVTPIVGLLLVHSDLGASAGSEMALVMSGYVPAQIGIAVVVIALVGRIGYIAGLLIGTLTYACLALLAAQLPVGVSIAASVLLLLIGGRLVRVPVDRYDTAHGAEQSKVTAGPLMITLRAGVALATALGLWLTAQAFGTAAGGAIGAFPIFTFTLCSFIVATSGQLGVRRVLAGMVQGLPPYFGFVLTYGLTVTLLGALGSSIAGGLVCACCYLAIVCRASRHELRRRSSKDAGRAGGRTQVPQVDRPRVPETARRSAS